MTECTAASCGCGCRSAPSAPGATHRPGCIRAIGRRAGLTPLSAYRDAIGRELFRTNGTTGGTRLVEDIWPGADWSAPSFFAAVGPRICFAARTAAHGEELWRSNGTTTVRVKDINPGPADSEPQWLVKSGKRLFFIAVDGTHGDELWVWKP